VLDTLLAERGGNVPIIFDDALVYCDDDRINKIDALSRAGKHQQVIVLTLPLAYLCSMIFMILMPPTMSETDATAISRMLRIRTVAPRAVIGANYGQPTRRNAPPSIEAPC
jgi:hypothetical protein